MNSRPVNGTPVQRVSHVEQAIQNHFGSPPRFLAFLALHEFEAWLFSSRDVVPTMMIQPQKQLQFVAIRESVTTPEDINERPGFAPSKRLEQLFPAYRKTLHGPTAAARIGLGSIQRECPHFADWLFKLEQFASS